MTEQYIKFGQYLKILLAGAKLVNLQKPGEKESIFVQDEAFIPLEDSAYPEGTRFISLSKYHPDPEGGHDTPAILFECRDIDGQFQAEPIAYLHEKLGIKREVHERDKKGTILTTNEILKLQVTAYAQTTFETLRTHGYFNYSAKRNRLEEHP